MLQTDRLIHRLLALLLIKMSEKPHAAKGIHYYKYHVKYSLLLTFFIGGEFSNTMLKGCWQNFSL